MATEPRIALALGDITRIPADAIVDAANSGLRGGGGVDGAIHRAGGPAVMADLVARYGPDRHCPPGGAVVSTAGRLPARFVIHAVGPVWRGGGEGEPERLAAVHRAALDIALAEGCRTVTFPAISTGVYGYPVELAASVAIPAVAGWLAEHPGGLDAVTFVLFSRPSFEAYERALAVA